LYAIFVFVSIFPSRAAPAHPIEDYYIFDNGQNGLRDGDGAKLNEKKKKYYISVTRSLRLEPLCATLQNFQFGERTISNSIQFNS